MTPAQRHQILVEWNDSDRGYVPGCVHQVFEERVKRSPHAVALLWGDRKLTFAELNAFANQIARQLKRRGVGPEVLTALCFMSGFDGIAAMLGVLKAGGAYLPLDPYHPPQRLLEVLTEARPKVILTTSEFKHIFSSVPQEIVCLDRDRKTIEAELSDDLECTADPDNAVYVAYTSGSTGKPKGVIAVHRSILNGLSSLPFGVDADDVCSLNTGLSSAFSWARVFLPLFVGVPLVIIPEEDGRNPELLVAALEKWKVTGVAVVTPMFREILHGPGSLVSRLGKLRVVAVGGSRVTPDLIEEFIAAVPDAKVLHGYGNTEAGGAVVVWPIGGKHDDTLPAGRPFPNTRVYLLDQNFDPVPAGAPGGLYLSAKHLSRGYLCSPGFTGERFLPNPFAMRPGERLYATGDTARFRPDGRIEILGRTDDQVKIRGYRVELGEVEAALRSHRHVHEAAVVAVQDGEDWRLGAYIVPQNAEKGILKELKADLRRALPDYMVPSAFMCIESLPLTSLGKVDRTALPPIDPARRNIDGQYAEPRNPIEAAVASIWSQTLGIERVGIHDAFLELGGHSLSAAKILSHIRLLLNVELPPQTLLQCSTVAELTEKMFQGEEGRRKFEALSSIIDHISELTEDEASRELEGLSS